MKKKSKSIIKNIGLGCTATLCVATLGLGSFYFLDFAKNGFGKNVIADTGKDNTQIETPDTEEPTTQEFNFKFQDGALVGYSGEMSEKLVIPQTYSTSGVESKTKIFNDNESLMSFCENIFDTYYNSPNGEEVFNYTFRDSREKETICKSLEGLREFIMNLEFDTYMFPISVDYEEKNFCEGTDYLVTEIGPGIFNSADIGNLKTIIIPKTVTRVCSAGAFANASNLQNFVVEAENTNFESADGILVDKISKAIVAFPNGKTGDYIMPDNLTFNDLNGNQGMMFRNSELNSFKINDNVSEIYTNMFVDSKIGQVIFGKNVATVGSCAFMNFGGNSIIMNDGLETIMNSAFSNVQIDTLNIPSSVKKIETAAFMNSTIKTITIPENATFNVNCFTGCNDLSTVLSYTPADVLKNEFKRLSQDITIYVPAELIEEYQNAFASASNIRIRDISSYTN